MPEEIEKDIFGHEERNELTEDEREREAFNPSPPIYLTLFILLLALGARLAILFFYTEPDNPGPNWYGDVWHHWQIAYLSKEVGFKEGFLRLWDFKGMEYYWGLLHPLILIAGFIISGSVSILVPRMVSVIFSSLAIMLVFLIIARYFNKKAAFASALFLTFMPVTLFSDTLGMQEPPGVFLLLLGVYLLPYQGFIAGFSWMLAGMVRAEYWLFGAGLLLAVLLRERNFDRKISTLFGYGVPLVFYLKYMLDRTGNLIYPIYWNFLAIMVGEWFEKAKAGEILPPLVQQIKVACQFLTGFFLLGGLIVLWRRFKGYLFFLAGFANLAFIFSILGFGAYLFAYETMDAPGFLTRIWVSRFFAFPWGFLGVLAAVILLYLLPKKLGKMGTFFGAFTFLAVLGMTQFIWPSINHHYTKARRPLEASEKFAAAVGAQYTGRGTLYIPGGRPTFTYSLVYHQGIPGDKLISHFYDPFYYYEGDPFVDWGTFRGEIITWLQKYNAELFVVVKDIGLTKGSSNYGRMMALEEGKLFELLDDGEGYRIYAVTINKD